MQVSLKHVDRVSFTVGYDTGEVVFSPNGEKFTEANKPTYILVDGVRFGFSHVEDDGQCRAIFWHYDRES